MDGVVGGLPSMEDDEEVTPPAFIEKDYLG